MNQNGPNRQSKVEVDILSGMLIRTKSTLWAMTSTVQAVVDAVAEDSVDAVIDRFSGEMKDTLAKLEPVISVGIPLTSDQVDEDDEVNALEDFSMNLPQLINRMKEMVELMEKNTKIYESLKANAGSLHRADSTSSSEGDDDDNHDSRQSLWLNDAGRQSTYLPRDSTYMMRESHRAASTSWRASVFESSTAPLRSSTSMSAPDSFSGSERQSFSFSESFKRVPVGRNMKPISSRVRLDVPGNDRPVPVQARRIDYSVKWSRGDLGISLNNFTKDRRGFQISSLEQSAQCFTAGISNARLGDLLVFINHHDVEHLPCDQIKDILLRMPRPLELSFRSNPNTVTSPSSAKKFQANQRIFEEAADDVAPHLVLPEAPLKDPVARTTDSTVNESVYNEELEDWLRRQDEMHSDLVLLLTETIHRCESLQEDNFDQLQKMMERAMRRRASSAAFRPPVADV
ncbi:unnamed protein product [Aphanomyces euteiches]|nr:hypothetical protein AeRB84_002692 [Aphanomyces euteiches]